MHIRPMTKIQKANDECTNEVCGLLNCILGVVKTIMADFFGKEPPYFAGEDEDEGDGD